MGNYDIGRKDSRDEVAITKITATSAAGQLLPTSPLGRRNFILVRNIGATAVAITTSTTMAAANGFPLAAGAEWSEETNAPLYVRSTGANSDVVVYERASKRVPGQEN